MMKKKTIFKYAAILIPVFLLVVFWAYRYAQVGERIIKVEASGERGFFTEYYLFIPDTCKSSDEKFLLVEMNNTGFVDDDHSKHLQAAYDTICFGQAHTIAEKLGVPLLIPCFDRPETNWEFYTHALDRDTLLIDGGALNRIDRQLLAMIADAHTVLAHENIQLKDKILLNGFSASGSFANRFTALYPERVAGVAAGGINGIAILPVENANGRTLIYPIGVSDVREIAGIDFQLQEFAAVPQFYYMGGDDNNDALPYDDAYSDLEREIVKEVLDEDMSVRWEDCQKWYECQGIRAQFRTYPGIGHETNAEVNADILSFFEQVMKESQ